MKRNKMLLKGVITLFSILIIGVISIYQDEIKQFLVKTTMESYALEEVPNYSNEEYVYLIDNHPNFEEEAKKTESFEQYADLDLLGRAGRALANIGIDLMPTEERGSIGMIKPSGWNQKKYDFIDGKYLYNRCHLIGYQLTGENANEKNLITCTRQMNTGAMLDFENKVANYIRKTHNHVLYRATPIYQGTNLLASGVELEGLSIEDGGKGIEFHVYIYNVQDGVNINYETGENHSIR